MRLRHKRWALPEMRESELFIENYEEVKGNWRKVFGNENPISLELGCGKGDFIKEAAKRDKNRNFIAIDSKNEVLVYALRKVADEGLENVRFLSMNIEKIEDVFAEGEIDSIYINFCNPWPKKSHHKRRLTHSNFLKKYKNISKKELKIFFKTDDFDLFEASKEYFKEEGFKIEYETEDLDENMESNIVTEYERKFRDFGIQINMIKAVRNKDKEK